MRKLEVPFSIMSYIQKFFSYKKNRVQLCLKLNISKPKHEVVGMSATWHGLKKRQVCQNPHYKKNDRQVCQN